MRAAAPCCYWHWSNCAACRAREPVPRDREPVFDGTAARLDSCSAAVPVFPSNIHGIERFWMGSLFGADSQPPVSGSGTATSGRLGRVTVLPQLKVDRLCSVVDGTADFDPKLPYGGPADQSPGESERGPLRQTAGVDADDTVRFCALRLYESGLINSNPKKIIAEKTDWRSSTSSNSS